MYLETRNYSDFDHNTLRLNKKKPKITRKDYPHSTIYKKKPILIIIP